ncbi:MAG: hypothetical protein R3272_09230 [Candidatus Promineifilaceae bacterium]|nr:hypothetical protein [Candidatus Promineifilaceae bacterium]
MITGVRWDGSGAPDDWEEDGLIEREPLEDEAAADRGGDRRVAGASGLLAHALVIP